VRRRESGISLLSEVAVGQPLVCVVDDAQWLDQASALTLAFVVRRLLAEPVVMLFAARQPGVELRGLPELAAAPPSAQHGPSAARACELEDPGVLRGRSRHLEHTLRVSGATPQ
jgi:hypothetical protein